jgi:hypothetical protein
MPSAATVDVIPYCQYSHDPERLNVGEAGAKRSEIQRIATYAVVK